MKAVRIHQFGDPDVLSFGVDVLDLAPKEMCGLVFGIIGQRQCRAQQWSAHHLSGPVFDPLDDP